MNCHYCGQSITDAWIRQTLGGFKQGSRLNGMSYTVHARCVRPVFPDRDIPLPERVSDPIAEPDAMEQVVVYLSDGEWLAYCRECGNVAQKAELDDAHLAAASHVARVHSGLVRA